MMKMGPNDVSGVVWALGEPFFFFIINHFTNLLLRLCVQPPPLGPNDSEPLFGLFYIQSYSHVKPLDASHPLWKWRWEQQVQAQQGRNRRQQGSRRYTS